MSLPALSSFALMVSILAGCLPAAPAQADRQPDPRLQRIMAVLDQARPALIAFRRDLHRHPEVSGREERTARRVAERLRALGLEVETGVGGHGVVGVLRGGRPGPVVAYRADMDAVYSDAPDPAPFRSETPGVRHICGHDVHTTVALGIAEALAAIRADLPGTVKFIFQPAEENAQGVRAMIRDGVLDDPAPAAIFAVHSAPMQVGQIGAVEGMGLPGLDRITVAVRGSGDLAGAARAYAAALSGLSTVGPPGSGGPPVGDFIYARGNASPDPADPEQWLVQGFVKASGEAAYAEAKQAFKHRLAELTPPDVRYELAYQDRVLPDMINDADLVRASLEPLRNVVGDAGLIQVSSPSPYFGEDFAFYQQVIPGAMYWLGVSNAEEGMVGMPHSPGFAAADEAVIVGAQALSAVLLDFLEAHRLAE